jgi:Na+/H+ antiporter NhaD/arsenite permease-like protein
MSFYFFAALFVLMQSVWNSGLFQALMMDLNLNITSIPVMLAISVLLSQLISNVPLVALYIPILIHAGASTEEMMALAAGSTIAGNMLILGAASNVIISQNAEKKGETLTFFEFAKVGVPLTIINILCISLMPLMICYGMIYSIFSLYRWELGMSTTQIGIVYAVRIYLPM